MPDRPEMFAIKSYRYLRLSIVIVTVSLGASIGYERRLAPGFETSISAYFYTPSRGIFVGGLVAIGVCLIAIKEVPEGKDVLLNLAGVLAPIVAFVPTGYPGEPRSSRFAHSFDTEPHIDNNISAFIIGGAIAIVIAYFVADRRGASVTDVAKKLEPSAKLGLAGAGFILGSGVVWYARYRASFLEHAHFAAAIAMFAIIGVVMAWNALERARRTVFRITYACTAAAMVAIAIGVGVGTLVDEGWEHEILVLEMLEIIAFLVYWVVQTREHWNGGVPPAPGEVIVTPGVIPPDPA
jgi:hypothetical protein